MDDEIKQIGERLRGLRDVLQLSQEEMAQQCDIPLQRYVEAESGTKDIVVSLLQKVSKCFHISLDELMFGTEPRLNHFFVTRANKGKSIERVKTYKYQSLAWGFKGRLVDPLLVTVEPMDKPIKLNSHKGQEFNIVTDGEIKILIDGKEVYLKKGDSIYFDSSLPHGMEAMNNEPAQFLTVII